MIYHYYPNYPIILIIAKSTNTVPPLQGWEYEPKFISYLVAA
jgi:hypothetical protein